jgi:hypothetical protein
LSSENLGENHGNKKHRKFEKNIERFRKNHTLMLAVAIYVSMENSKIVWLRSRGEHPSLNILGGFNIEHRTLFIIIYFI